MEYFSGFLAISLFLSFSSAFILGVRDEIENTTINRRASRPAQHCGTFPLPCIGVEGACNNACYHIKCINPASRTKTYIGPNMVQTANVNRIDAETTTHPGGAFCRGYPFSQIMVDDQSGSSKGIYDTDEWPMATSKQSPYAQRGPKDQNSLRCIPMGENRGAGGKFLAFEKSQGQHLGLRDPACAGDLVRSDTYDVTFNLGGANQAKLEHCIDLYAGQMDQDCDDYHQARLTSKPTKNGKLSAPYNPFKIPGPLSLGAGSDNHYAIQYGSRPDMMQCSVEYLRTEHNEVSARAVNWKNEDQLSVRTTNPKIAYNTTLTGLPFDLVVMANGGLGSQLRFVYGNQLSPNNRISYFEWDLGSVGAGVGASSSNLTNYKFCKIEKLTVQYNPQDNQYPLGLKADPKPAAIKGLKQQDTERISCYFPCYMVATL